VKPPKIIGADPDGTADSLGGKPSVGDSPIDRLRRDRQRFRCLPHGERRRWNAARRRPRIDDLRDAARDGLNMVRSSASVARPSLGLMS
jgi:hypothetical protein